MFVDRTALRKLEQRNDQVQKKRKKAETLEKRLEVGFCQGSHDLVSHDCFPYGFSSLSAAVSWISHFSTDGRRVTAKSSSLRLCNSYGF